jgi:uncharacterized membrane protein
MSLVLIVYLIGVLPALTGLLGFIGGFGSFALVFVGTILTLMNNFMTRYSWDDKTEFDNKKAACGVWGKRAFKCVPITLLIALFAALIPNERTMYTMVAAYGVEKVIANPEVQSIASDGADVLKQLLAKAKKELEEPEEKPKK